MIKNSENESLLPLKLKPKKKKKIHVNTDLPRFENRNVILRDLS